MSRRTLWLLLRFAAAFGLLAWLAAAFPIYSWLERPVVATANALLHQRGLESRTLALEAGGEGGPTYVYELRLGGQARRVERPIHAHGFVALIFASLVLATPGLGLRRLAWVVAIGAPLVFALCALMLMSDVALWESEAVAAMNVQPPEIGPYRIPLGFVAGLHRTAAAGLLPIALWALVAVRPPARPRG